MNQPYQLFETYSTRPGDAPHQVDSRKVIRGLSDGAGKLLFGKSTMAMSGSSSGKTSGPAAWADCPTSRAGIAVTARPCLHPFQLLEFA
ncbi:hypothetical protein ACQR05_28495 [Bradyrhizobium oligotrophicum]|uniref:hypothetical protein n=1 Tax=Bradyrhizobium oligotrophicum TaxID=44255 RepID=UPI003EBDB811